MVFRKKFTRFTALFLLALFFSFTGAGCGGSVESKTYIGLAMLAGPLVEATATLYKYSDPTTPVWQGTTTNSDIVIKAGLIELPQSIVDSILDDDLYFVTVTGGSDIDANDDGVLDDTTTPNSGTLQLLAPGRVFKQVGEPGSPAYIVSALSTMIFEMLFPGGVKDESETEVLDRINLLAVVYLDEDINGDGIIDMEDIMDWDMAGDSESLTLSQTIFDDILDQIYGGGDIVFTITASAGAGGSITPDTALVLYGDEQTHVITPDTGYHITDVFVDGTSVGAVATYTFSNVTVSHTISASFLNYEAPVYTSGSTAPAINENSGPGRVIYTAAATDATAVTYSLKPGTGDVASFSINTSSGAVTLTGNPDYEIKPNYSFTVVATDTVGNSSEQVVTFAIIDLTTITVTVDGGNGNVLPGTGTVMHGAVEIYTITPDVEYALKDVLLDGVSVTADGDCSVADDGITTYEFVNDTGDPHTISVSFEPLTRIPDTGQITSHTTTFGEDSDYNTLNQQSYTDMGNGTVRDNVTGLIWELKTNDGSIHDWHDTYPWCDTNPATNGGNQGICGAVGALADTEDFIRELNDLIFAGYSDWRLPTGEELFFIINSEFVNPAINPDFLSGSQLMLERYWSSTTSPAVNSAAVTVNYNLGVIRSPQKSVDLPVRAVRGGQ